MTLSNAAAARMRLIVWCWDCRHQVEPDAAEMAERYGAETTVSDWREVDHTEIGLTLLSVSQDFKRLRVARSFFIKSNITPCVYRSPIHDTKRKM